MKSIVLRLFDLIRRGELKFMINGISKRILSKTIAFGLKRDLNIPFPIPDAQMDITIRLFKEEDRGYFSADLHNHGLIEKDIPKCYVSITSDGKPCFRQWLIGSEHKTEIKEFWGPSFPFLKDDEMLLEGGFTISSLRGKGIMPAGITRIIEKERREGMRWVITYVGIDNVASLKGIHRSGFSPYTLRIEKWILFKRTVTFKKVSEDLINGYNKKVGKS